jgi:hypothetical protein
LTILNKGDIILEKGGMIKMLDNLRRANAWQVGEFIKKGAEGTAGLEAQFPQGIEKAYDEADSKMYSFAHDVLHGDSNPRFSDFLDILNQLEQSSFVLGMKAGIKLATSFELGEK